jgi:hypothetical protein
MSNFWEEFGFIPPELLYKCDGIVRAFHKARGGGKDFVTASLLFSQGSPNLIRMAHNVVAIGKLIPLLVGVSVIVFVISLLTNIWWSLLAIIPIGAVIYLSLMIKRTLIQHRAVILAVETLATDVAGWGQLFPAARSKAEAIRAQAIFAPANRENFLSGDLTGDGLSLIKLYLPERIRDTDFISTFAPSEGSIKSATARPVTGKTVGMAAAAP